MVMASKWTDTRLAVKSLGHFQKKKGGEDKTHPFRQQPVPEGEQSAFWEAEVSQGTHSPTSRYCIRIHTEGQQPLWFSPSSQQASPGAHQVLPQQVALFVMQKGASTALARMQHVSISPSTLRHMQSTTAAPGVPSSTDHRDQNIRKRVPVQQCSPLLRDH